MCVCYRIGDSGVRYIMEGACGIKLQELNLTNCVRVGDVAIVNIHKRFVVILLWYNCTYINAPYSQHVASAEEQMVFLGGHQVTYYPPHILCSVYVLWATIVHQLSSRILQTEWIPVTQTVPRYTLSNTFYIKFLQSTSLVYRGNTILDNKLNCT